MVFEVALPFFGVTVTVTLQEPAFRPLRVPIDTLQFFAKLETTLRETFDVESTFSLANAAIDFAEAAFDNFTVSTVALGATVVVVVTTGAIVVVVVVVTTGATVVVVVTTGATVVVGVAAGILSLRLGLGAEKCVNLKSTRTPLSSVVMPNV